MAKTDQHLKVTADDLRATRVLTLAVKFFGASRPIASSTIRTDLYSELDIESFNRQYLRDRELLATFGIQVREAGQIDGDTLWQVDELTSYVQGDGLKQEDARMLYVLCHDMAFDQSFAYRDELRMALAKIAQMYRGSTLPHVDATTPTEHKILSTLVSCMSARHAVAVSYTDAHGTDSQRTLAVMGTFGLRDRTYFVASRIKKDGTLVPDSLRTYRLDRFSKAREIASISYKIPLDFSVTDFERLPFQMGDPIGLAHFRVTGDEGREATRAMATQGELLDVDSQTIWEVPYSSLQAVAAWSIGAGLSPAHKDDLALACSQIVQASAAVDAYDATLPSPDEAQAPRLRRSRAGRTGSVAVARQLVALASSLTREGDVITAENIAQTLGVDFDYARHLIMLVSMGSGESIDYLPVILSDDDDEVALMEGAGVSARRVRLTRSETIALSAALSELGVPDSDPLAQTLARSYASPSFSASDIARTLEEPSSTEDNSTLITCSKAIVEGKGLAFSYRPVSGGTASNRRVVPRLVRRSDDSWYLDAFDLVRADNRVFRIDRMHDVSLFDASMPEAPKTQEESRRLVTVRFDDRTYLDLFHWEGLEVIGVDDTTVTVRLPQFAGTWLARHLVACAGTVRIGDKQLADQVHEVTTELA
jgi:proteasome accessory factor C